MLAGELLAQWHRTIATTHNMPADKPLLIGTDSLASLYLATCQVLPEHNRLRKNHVLGTYRGLVEGIIDPCLAHPGGCIIFKVRAHIGIVGNTHADTNAAAGLTIRDQH